MKFSIITPTYKRPVELKRAVESILFQDYLNWELIIVNDSPDYDYSSIENSDILKKNSIKYFKNKENKGVNYSRNYALDNISENSDYFLFLDDDDWLNSQCLSEAVKVIEKNNNYDWFVSNRYDIQNNKSLTKNNLKKYKINYLKEYLIFKKFTGDATHIISTKYKNKQFSKKVKNAEEWIFFVQLSKYFLYYAFNSTFTNSYLDFGMTNYYNKNRKLRLRNTWQLFKESFKYKVFSFWVLIYFILRLGAIILK